MHVRRTSSVVTVLAPAKLNLFLEVLGKRADGFHEIETLMVPVRLSDSLSFAPAADGAIRCQCLWHPPRATLRLSQFPRVVLGDDNLAVRAAHLLRTAAGITAGATMQLVKRVPLEAGMAGGSSDAAAALVAANIGWQLNWPLERLSEIAAQLGSDVPFFLSSRPALCTGRGEHVMPLAEMPPLYFVIVKPPAGLSTAEVYRHCRPSAVPHSAQPLIDAWRRGCLADIGRRLHNRLEVAAAEISPTIEQLRGEFNRFDFIGHQMTGSGSAYFGICRHAKQARRLAAALRSRGFAQVFAVAGPN